MVACFSFASAPFAPAACTALMFASLARLRDITAIVARHGLSHYWQKRRPTLNKTSSNTTAAHAAAQRFCEMLEELGPTFIKFGQILSSRRDILPAEFADALASLQDRCQAMTPPQVQQAVETGLGQSIDSAFVEFDFIPLASASIAQVHRAKIGTGQQVAVKVQRLHIRQQIEQDMDLLGRLAQMAELIVEESGLAAPQELVQEFDQVFLKELNFCQEAKVMQLFYQNAQERSHLYTVPKVFESLSSNTILTMELLHGTPLSQLKSYHDSQKIAENVVKTAFAQVFVDGLFHADPHPGNCLILDDNRLALLDFGCTGRISAVMRETLVTLAIAVAIKDADTIARTLYRMSTVETTVSLQKLRDDIAAMLHTFFDDRRSFAQTQITALLGSMLHLATVYRIALPVEYALVLRAAMTLEGVLRDLDPEFKVAESMMPMLRSLIEEQFQWLYLRDTALKSALRFRDWVRDMPLSLSQILLDLEMGKLQLKIQSPALEQLSRSVHKAALLILMGLLLTSVVACLLFGEIYGQGSIQIGGIPMLWLINGCLVTLLAVLLVYMFWIGGSWQRKVSLKKFFKP